MTSAEPSKQVSAIGSAFGGGSLFGGQTTVQPVLPPQTTSAFSSVLKPITEQPPAFMSPFSGGTGTTSSTFGGTATLPAFGGSATAFGAVAPNQKPTFGPSPPVTGSAFASSGALGCK